MTAPQEPIISRPGFKQVAPPLLSLLLFLGIFYIPFFGLMLNFFAPLPLIYCFFTSGRKSWFFASIAVAAVISLFLGPKIGIFYLFTYSVMALVMAETILRKNDMSYVIGLGAIVPFLATGFFFLISSPVPINGLYPAMLEQASIMIAETIQNSQKAGMPKEQTAFIAENSVELAGWVIKLLPVMFAVAYLSISFCNFFFYRRIQRKYTFLPMADPMPLKLWIPQDKFVYGFIGSLALLLLGTGIFNVIGVNIFMFFGFIYLIAGVSVLSFFMDKFNVPFLLRTVVYMLIIIQPFFLSMVSGLGLFDLWFDFRQIRGNGKEKTDKNSKEE